MKRYLLPIFFLLVFGTIFIQPFLVFSEELSVTKEEIETLNRKITEKKNKIKQLEESIENVRKSISKKRTEAVSLSNQISLLDNRLLQVELDIEATRTKLDTLYLEIERLKLSIVKKEADIAKQKKILAEFLRTIYQENGKHLVEILAAYDDFSDFYSRLQYLEIIEQNVGSSARSLRIAKDELEEKKRIIEERQEVYEALNIELSQKRDDLQDQAFVKENLLMQTQASELQFKTLQNSLKKQAEEIENEISGIEQEVRRRLESEMKLRKDESDDLGSFLWPAPSRYVTAYFHDPDYPYRHVFEHSGIDIRAGQGTPIKAATSGYVARARHCNSASCYSYIVLVHSGGLSTVYGHMSKPLVQEDQFVTRGEVIGLSGGFPGTVGAGPFVTGPHLHFEIRKNGIPINPLGYLTQ